MSDKVINITVTDDTQEVINIIASEAPVYSVNGQVGYVNLDIPTNVVFTYSDQNINGLKTFVTRPQVNGTGVLLSGEVAALPVTLVYTTGDQTLGSTKNFTGGLQYRGNQVLTGVELSAYTLNANTGSFITNSQTGNFYANSNPSGYITGIELSAYTLNANTGSFITNSQTGNFYANSNPSGYITGVNLSAYTLNANTGSFVNTSQTGTFLTTSYQFSGDLTGSAQSLTVKKLQGYSVNLASTPADGQILQWNNATSSWVAGAIPGGGNGGGGRVYYFDFGNKTGIAPTGGLPTTGDNPLSLLGIDYAVGSGSGVSAELDPRYSEHLICSFVTASGNPGVTNIPAGLWDFNVWANVNNASTVQCSIRAQISIYNPITSGYRYLASTDDVYLYETDTIAQYILNATVPQTGITNNERIYIQIFGKKYTTSNRNITLYFDSYRPSHVHTTIPSVAGDGVVKVVNGVLQTPATGIFNADVDANANIAQSKIANLVNDLANLYPRTNPSGFLTSSGVVFTTGNQTISGNKTFNGNINFGKSNYISGNYINLQSTPVLTGLTTTGQAVLSIRALTTRSILNQSDGFGASFSYQPGLIERNNISYYLPTSNSIAINNFNFVTNTAMSAGNRSARSIGSSSFFDSTRRVSYTGTAAGTAGSNIQLGIYNATAADKQWFRGTNGYGGFYFKSKFGIGDMDNAITGKIRGFVGLADTSATVTNTQPSNRTFDLAGIGFDSGDLNWYFMHTATNNNPTKVSLGQNYSNLVKSGNFIEFSMYATPDGGVGFYANIMNSGLVYETGYYATGNIPNTTVLMGPNLTLGTPDISGLLEFSINGVYIESFK